jgi:4-phytase/acid phosphatase
MKWFLILAAILALLPLETAAQQPSGKLVRVVMLSRHGVRSPTQSTEALNGWRQPPLTPAWPDFGVPPGYLTPKGQVLVQEMGAYYRQYLDKAGLFQPARCPDGVFIWADQDQRTLETAQALGIGLARENGACHFEVSKATDKIDPVFHPTEALPQCRLDPDRVREAVGDLDNLSGQYKPQLDEAQTILGCCSVKLCENACNGLGDDTCTLPTLSSCAGAAKGQASISGGFGVAQSFAEILLLQYAQGFGGDNFGFGRADKASMLDTLQLHTAVFSKVQRAHYVSQRQGANLLYHIAYAVKNGRDPGTASGDNKFIAYVGHDTNIANVAALLNLHWTAGKYSADDMPPGGALIFEVRQEPASVSAFFAAQSPDDMRNQMGEPDQVPVKIPRCGNSDRSCPLEDFVKPMAEFLKMTRPILDSNRQCLTD